MAEEDVNRPFLHIQTEECTAELFLKTVAEHTEQAWRFVSKAYIGNLDLNELRDLLRTGEYKLLASPREDLSEHRRVNSILLFNRAVGTKNVLHLHMVKEPARGGQWKIICIDRET